MDGTFYIYSLSIQHKTQVLNLWKDHWKIKVSNLKRQYETKHKNFKEIIPQKILVGITKVSAMK